MSATLGSSIAIISPSVDSRVDASSSIDVSPGVGVGEVVPHQWNLPLTLESRLTSIEASGLLDGDVDWGNVRRLWSVALRQKRPIRLHAAAMGIDELPDPDMETWRREFKHCFACGQEYWRMEVHHIERRGQAHSPREDRPENWLLVCCGCHADYLATMPHAKQLAHKWICDPCGHATLATLLERWLRIKDPELKAPNRVTVAEVEDWEKAIRGYVRRGKRWNYQPPADGEDA